MTLTFSRANRGARMAELLAGAEKETAVEEAYQEYFGDEQSDDDEYVEEAEEEDVVDSDFFDSEPEDEAAMNEVEVQKAERAEMRKERKTAVQKYGKSSRVTAQSLPDLSDDDTPKRKPSPTAGKKRKSAETSTTTSSSSNNNKNEGPSKSGLRRSTQARSSESQTRAIIAETRRQERGPIRRREQVVWTQEERLEEAKLTEQNNTIELHALLKIEEERKKIVQRKPLPPGPLITWISSRGNEYMIFNDMEEYPSAICQQPVLAPPKPMCVITGLPAKYIDPVTKYPYANVEAFRILRSQYVS